MGLLRLRICHMSVCMRETERVKESERETEREYYMYLFIYVCMYVFDLSRFYIKGASCVPGSAAAEKMLCVCVCVCVCVCTWVCICMYMNQRVEANCCS